MLYVCQIKYPGSNRSQQSNILLYINKGDYFLAYIHSCEAAIGYKKQMRMKISYIQLF